MGIGSLMYKLVTPADSIPFEHDSRRALELTSAPKKYPTMFDESLLGCCACKNCVARNIDDGQPPSVCLKLGCFIITDNQCGGLYFKEK